jgi:hypothetical protein
MVKGRSSGMPCNSPGGGENRCVPMKYSIRVYRQPMKTIGKNNVISKKKHVLVV